jgi:hypothetical protein
VTAQRISNTYSHVLSHSGVAVVDAQGRPLHCSGFSVETGVSSTCEILNLSTQKYEPFPSLPIGAFAAEHPHGLAVQLVRCAQRVTV